MPGHRFLPAPPSLNWRSQKPTSMYCGTYWQKTSMSGWRCEKGTHRVASECGGSSFSSRGLSRPRSRQLGSSRGTEERVFPGQLRDPDAQAFSLPASGPRAWVWPGHSSWLSGLAGGPAFCPEDQNGGWKGREREPGGPGERGTQGSGL